MNPKSLAIHDRFSMSLLHPSQSTALALLANRSFRTIWFMGSVGEFARRTELLVLSWLILQLTDSYLQLGLVLVFNNLPRPVFSTFTGLIADRFDRRMVLIVAQTVNTCTAGVVLALMIIDIDAVQPWHAFAAIFIQGAVRAVEDPSRRTGILDIVGPTRLVNALSLEIFTNTAGKMTGPLLAGVMLAAVGFQGSYVLVVAIHLANLALATQLKIPQSQGGPPREPVWRSLAVGFRYALGSRELLGVMYVTIFMNALAFPVQQFVPAVGRDNLDVGIGLVGLLVAAEGFGQLAGAGTLALGRGPANRGAVFVLGSMLVLAVGLAFAWAPWYSLALLILAIGGMGQAGFGAMQSAITLLAAPPEMRGRMMGVLSQCIGIGTILGTLEMGLIASRFSIQWAISGNVLAGMLLVAPVLVFSTLVRPRANGSPAVTSGAHGTGNLPVDRPE